MPYTCNNCKSHVETRYHCTVCDDFDLCVNCKDKDGHPHPMEKLGFALDNWPALTGEQRCLLILEHAPACRDAECHLPEPISSSCRKMKRVLIHAKHCKTKINGNCPICKQLFRLVLIHEEHCEIRANDNCPICEQSLSELCFVTAIVRIRFPHQVRDEAATIATGSTAQQQQHQAQPMALGAQMPAITRTGWWAFQSAPDKRYALAEPQLQQLIQISRSSLTPDQRNYKIFQIFKRDPAFMAALRLQFGQHGGRVGGSLGPNQPQ